MKVASTRRWSCSAGLALSLVLASTGAAAQDAGSSGLAARLPDKLSTDVAAQDEASRRTMTATDIADDFTFAAVGDILASRAEQITARNRDVAHVLQSADMTMGNFEAPVIDLRQRGLQPTNGGGFLISMPPEIPQSLSDWGFDMVGYANNHSMDWGVEGARDTIRRLEAAGIVSAGFGETRTGARSPAYFATPKGRIALVSFTASYFGGNAAADPLGAVPGVPGISALRTTPIDIVTREQFATLREIDAQHNAGGLVGRRPTGDELLFRGRRFRVGDKPDTIYQINAEDQADIIRSVRQAKQQSNFLVVSVHNHEEPNCEQPVQSGDGSAWPCLAPPDFLRTMAHAVIDNGADAFVGHGPHVLQGIEIYKGRPIFYSLGNLFASLAGVTKLRDAIPTAMDATRQTEAEYLEGMWSLYEQDSTIFQTVIALSRYRGNRLAEIRLHPVDLGQHRRQADRGAPETPSPTVARQILERLQRLSAPFGTKISIEGNIGIIRISADSR